MLPKAKREILARYDGKEVAFMDEVLIPLFEKMGFTVFRNHGSTEFGKDLVLRTQDSLGNQTNFCVLIKCGEITNTSAGKSKKTVAEVQRQAEQCWKMPLDRFNMRGILPNQVWIVTNNRITHTSRDEIQASVQAYNKSNTLILSNEELIPHIDKHYPELWIYSMPTLSSYLKDLVTHIETRTLFSAGFRSSLGNLVGTRCWKWTPDFEGKNKVDIKGPSEIIKESNFVWIQGGTGSGKTFVVREFTEKILKNLEGEQGEKNPKVQDRLSIPTYIRCSHLSQEQVGSALDLLLKAAQEYSPHLQDKDFGGWIKKYPLVIFLDEFEINPDPSIVDDLLVKIASFTAIPPSVVILSRHDLRPNLGPRVL